MKEEKRKVPRLRFPGFERVWEERKFDEWGEFYYGRSCPKWSVTEDATIPCVRYGELYTKFGTKIDRVYSYTNMPPEKLRFSKGTEVLIPRVGEDPMDYNHCTWLSLKNVAIGEMISVFNTDQDPLFSAMMFNAVLQKEFAIRVEGGSVTNLYYDKLRNIRISYPSLAEQKKIAAHLGNLDALITLHQRKLDQIKEYKKGMLQKMFPKKGETVPEVRFPGFEGDWEERMFSNFTRDVGRRNKDNLKLEPYAVTNDRGFIRQADAHDEFGYMKNVDRKAYNIVPPKAFAYNPARINVGSIGYYDGTESVIVSSLYEVFQTDDSVDDRFLWHWFKSDFFPKWIEKLQEGSVRFYFYYDKLCECHMLMPSIDEQRKISDYIDTLDALIFLHQQKLDEMKEYKKGLLQQMFV